MNKNEFLTQMQDILQRDDAGHETDVLADYEEGFPLQNGGNGLFLPDVRY